jgi:hypothetical protein
MANISSPTASFNLDYAVVLFSPRFLPCLDYHISATHFPHSLTHTA